MQFQFYPFGKGEAFHGLLCDIISNTKCANMKIESNNKWTKTIPNYNVQTHFRFTTFGGFTTLTKDGKKDHKDSLMD